MNDPASSNEQGASRSIFNNAVCLSLSTHALGNSKKVPMQFLEIVGSPSEDSDASPDSKTVDKDRLNASMKLLKSPEYDAIKSLYTEMKKYLRSHSVPVPKKSALSRLFRGGIYLQPKATIEEVDQQLSNYRQQLTPLVTQLADAWARLVEQAEHDLGPLFDPKYYPSAEDVRHTFFFEWQYVMFSPPDSLTAEMFERERAKHEAQWEEATTEVKRVLTDGMAELVNHLVERLSPGEDGKAKKFHETTFVKLQEFLQFFESRNIINDQGLAELAQKARSIMSETNPAGIRKDITLRDSVRTKFEELKAQLDTMVVTQPSRVFSLDEE